MTPTFDTFKFKDRLEKAGFTKEQATAILENQIEIDRNFQQCFPPGTLLHNRLSHQRNISKVEIIHTENPANLISAPYDELEIQMKSLVADVRLLKLYFVLAVVLVAILLVVT